MISQSISHFCPYAMSHFLTHITSHFVVNPPLFPISSAFSVPFSSPSLIVSFHAFRRLLLHRCLQLGYHLISLNRLTGVRRGILRFHLSEVVQKSRRHW